MTATVDIRISSNSHTKSNIYFVARESESFTASIIHVELALSRATLNIICSFRSV